jgi:tetratricopeptide (TPR) repeat protein
VTVTTSDLTEDALLATGRCQAARGNFAAAGAAFSQLLQSKNADRRREARFEHARLLRQTGQYREALTALASIQEPRAEPERVLALAGAGRVPEALALTDSLIARGDTTKRWDSLLVILARDNPSAASGLVDRILRLRNRRGEPQVRMLLEDGLRLVSIDTARAARRFRETMAAGGTQEAAGRAGLALVKLGLIGVSSPADLAPVVQTLKSLTARYKMAADEISRFSATVADVHTTARSVTPDTAQGDLRLFLAAESARDSLAAPRLAEAIFRQIPEQWPLSPYAPKAIIAAQQLNPAWADSARALLDEQYFASPYLATVRGEATPEYRQLEDSLGAFAASLAVRRPPVLRRRPVPATARDRRPRPESGGSRVPEP